MLFKAPENRDPQEVAAAEPPTPLPLAARPINPVAASYVKTPGVGGYVKMMYFNPNHTPRNPNSLPVPPAAPAVHPNGAAQGPDGSRSFVMPTLPGGMSLPGGMPRPGGRSLPPIAGPGLPPLPMPSMPPHLMPPKPTTDPS